MVEQLISRTDAAYQRWLASVTDDVDADVVMMYCRESLPERNTTYGIEEWLPGYLMVGQEGDRGFFLRGDGGGPLFMGDLGSSGEADLEVIASGFEGWRRSGFALPPEPELDMPVTGDVYVSGIPIEGLQLLVRARKLLRADWRFADLRGMLATQPFLAASSAPLYRLRRELEDVPELRPHLFYATDDGLASLYQSPGSAT